MSNSERYSWESLGFLTDVHPVHKKSLSEKYDKAFDIIRKTYWNYGWFLPSVRACFYYNTDLTPDKTYDENRKINENISVLDLFHFIKNNYDEVLAEYKSKSEDLDHEYECVNYLCNEFLQKK